MTTQGSTFNQFAPSNFQSQMFGQQVSPVSQLPNQIYGGILDEEPRIPFFGALQRANLPSNQRDFYKGQFSDIFQQYQGLLDQYIRAGLEPNLRFADFVGNYDFPSAFRNLPIGQRQGIQGTANFAPPTMFLR